jgi:hypothetical protein
MSAARLQPKSEINESSLDGEDSDGDKLIAEQPLLIDTTCVAGIALQSTDCNTSRGKNKCPFKEFDDGI